MMGPLDKARTQILPRIGMLLIAMLRTAALTHWSTVRALQNEGEC